MSLALEKALTPRNIKHGFKGTGIWPLNYEAVVGKMGPSEQFQDFVIPGLADVDDNHRHPTFYDSMQEFDCESSDDGGHDDGHMHGRMNSDDGALGGTGPHSFKGTSELHTPGPHQQYYVRQLDCLADDAPNMALQAAWSCLRREGWNCSASPTSISHFLQLPELLVNPARRNSREPLVDYTKSIIMIGNNYIQAMEEKVARKESLEKEKELKKKEAELTRERRAEDKIQKKKAKLQCLEEVGAQRAFVEKWSSKAVAAASEKLHQLIKSSAPPPPGAYVGKFVTFCPKICLKNQAIAKARMKAKREGRTPDPAFTTIPPPWVHQPDRRFLIEIDMECDSEAT